MKKLVIEYWTPLVLWLLVIFSFSTDTFAASETSRIIVPLLKFCFPSLSPAELAFWHGFVRKLGHVGEYSVLAILAYRSLKADQPDATQANLRTLSLVVLAATSDEFHQRLTFFRTASPIDVGYDCLGAVGALWLITAYEKRRLRPHSIL